MVKFLGIFDPLPLSWSLSLNKDNAIKWSFANPLSPQLSTWFMDDPRPFMIFGLNGTFWVPGAEQSQDDLVRRWWGMINPDIYYADWRTTTASVHSDT